VPFEFAIPPPKGLKIQSCKLDRYSTLPSVANSLGRRMPVRASETAIRGASSIAVVHTSGAPTEFDEAKTKPAITLPQRTRVSQLTGVTPKNHKRCGEKEPQVMPEHRVCSSVARRTARSVRRSRIPANGTTNHETVAPGQLAATLSVRDFAV